MGGMTDSLAVSINTHCSCFNRIAFCWVATTVVDRDMHRAIVAVTPTIYRFHSRLPMFVVALNADILSVLRYLILCGHA